MATCPQCSLEVPEIYPLPADLRAKIKEVDLHFPLVDTLCKSCLATLQRQAYGTKGVLLSQERAKETKKKKMWQNRVSLVRNGHSLMKNNLHSEAAVSYEKYLRLVEMVFACGPGQLTPQMLKEAAKTAELTVIAGVYWDLVRIYDSSDKYGGRQKIAARQLAKFATYTPIFPDLIKKAHVFMKTARHPEVIKSFLVASKATRPRCFIATSAFATPMAEEIIFLREYRDKTLKTNSIGRKFVYLYYKISPQIACFLDKHETQIPWLKPAVRACLRLVIKCVRSN